MRTRLPTLLLALCLLPSLGKAASADIIVVAHPGVSFSSISLSQLNRLFLGQSNSYADGSHALPLDVSDKRDLFYQAILRKTPSQMERYWARMIFTGKSQPPRALPARDIKSMVAETSGAISYLSRSQLDASVKVITVINDR